MAHGDGDGVVSASLVKHIRPRAKVFFSHPAGLYGDLRELGIHDEIYILDIAITELHRTELVDFLNELVRRGSRVVYIDHHPLPALGRVGFEMVHEEGVSASELTFRTMLGHGDMDRVALYGAIVDYMDLTPWAQGRMRYWDKREIYYEAGILALGLEGSRREYGLKRELVSHLSVNGRPSSLRWLVERASREAEKNETLRDWVRKNVAVAGGIGWVLDPPGSLGHAATYALRYSRRLVGVALERRGDLVVGSLRSVGPELDAPLRILSRKKGWHAGGHRHAAGLRAKAPPEEVISALSEVFRQRPEPG